MKHRLLNQRSLCHLSGLQTDNNHFPTNIFSRSPCALLETPQERTTDCDTFASFGHPIPCLVDISKQSAKPVEVLQS